MTRRAAMIAALAFGLALSGCAIQAQRIDPWPYNFGETGVTERSLLP